MPPFEPDLNYPYKKFSAESPIDFSLFCHIHADAFIQGSYELEGNDFQRTQWYLEKFISTRQDSGSFHSERFKTSLAALLETQRVLKTLRQLDAQAVVDGVSKLAGTLTQQILTLVDDQYLAIPGGWSCEQGGHAMVYQFKKLTDSRGKSVLEFHIYNSGAGIRYHEQSSSKAQELFYPIQGYAIPLPIGSVEKLTDFIARLCLPRCGFSPDGKKVKNINEVVLYKEIFPLLTYINAQMLPMAERADYAYTPGQQSGTCTQQSLQQMLKATSGNLKIYQQNMYDLKRYALEDFIAEIQQKPELQDGRIFPQVMLACDTTLEMLRNLDDLFDLTKMQQEIDAIFNCKKKIRALSKKKNTPSDAPRPIDASLGALAIMAIHSTVPKNAPVFPKTQSVSPSQAAAIDIETTSELPSFKDFFADGNQLLQRLDDFIAYYESLEEKDEYAGALEMQESFFMNLPIPPRSDTLPEKLHPFYQEITQAELSLFSKKINEIFKEYTVISSYLAGNSTLPRQLPIALSGLSVLEHVMSALYAQDKNQSAAYAILQGMLKNFFDGRLDNPYFATNHPVFDKRLKEQQLRYELDVTTIGKIFSDSKQQYLSILKKYPELMEILLSWYSKIEIQSRLKAALDNSSREMKALYVFISQKQALSMQFKQYPAFTGLLQEFDHLFTLENTVYHYLVSFWGIKNDYSIEKPISFGVIGGQKISVGSAAIDFYAGVPSATLPQHKYPFEKFSPVQVPLTEDNSVLRARSFPLKANRKSRDENYIQVYPADADIKLAKEDLQAQLAAREITQEEMRNRELFHLRLVPERQIRLTLDYFRIHMDKLAEIDNQIVMEANFFEPGLLASELESNPNFWQLFDKFIEKGLRFFSVRGCASQSSIFYIRLQYLVNAYAHEFHAADDQIEYRQQRMQRLQQTIARLIQIEQQSNQHEILPSLHIYQFLTAMQRFDSRMASEDCHKILRYALPSLFYLKAHRNSKAFWDASNQFELEKAQNKFLKLLKKLDLRSECLDVIPHAIENIKIGVLKEVVWDANSPYLCHIFCETERGNDSFCLDIQHGLIVNESGYAYTAIPLDIENHPILATLAIDDLSPCLVSGDKNVYQLGARLRFIRRGSSQPYMVQKRWLIDDQDDWYELHSLHYAQQQSCTLAWCVIKNLPIPDIMQQRSNQIWINCTDNTRAIITDNQQPIVQCLIASNQITIQQLKRDPLELTVQSTNLILLQQPTLFHRLFRSFEAPEFMTVFADGQNPSYVEISFGRYDLTLVGYKQANQWTYHLKNTPEYQLDNRPSDPHNQAASLFFIDHKTKQMLVYRPVQRFYANDAASKESIFYQLFHDTSATIIKNDVTKSATFLSPFWQFTGEQYKIYKIDDKQIYHADTPADALYLAYTYLASHHPEKAWAVLDDCATRLGGLRSTEEELKFLEWILNALPSPLRDEDSKMKIASAEFLACQLKALSLFTASYRPDKSIHIKTPVFDPLLPDGFVQEKAWKALVEFNKGLNNIVYGLYSNYQVVQRYLTVPFQLKDAERASLLDYYELQLRSQNKRSLGALAYERHALQLRALKHEQKALLAKLERTDPKAVNPLLIRRLDEITQYLTDHSEIASQYTTVKNVILEFPLPEYTPTFWSHYSGDYPAGITRQFIETWWNNLARGIQSIEQSKIQSALALLTNAMTENEVLGYFPYYYALLIKPEYQEYKAQMTIFLQHYLLAHRHIPIEKQTTKTAYLLNILLRIANHSEIFNSKKNLDSFNDLLKLAHTLRVPTLEVYEIASQAGKILAHTEDMWERLDAEVSIKTESLIAEPCLRIQAFNLDALIASSKFASQQVQDTVQRNIALYQQHAAVYGVAHSTTAQDDRTNWLVYDLSEDQAGKQQQEALWAMKDSSFQLLNNPEVRETLRGTAQAFIDQLQSVCDDLLHRALTLANTAELDPRSRLKKIIAEETNHQQRLDKPALLRLYFHADNAEYKKVCGLNDAQIQQLHTCISHYVALTVRQKNLQRFMDKSSQLKQDTLNPSQCQLVAQELLATDTVDYTSEPVLGVFQADENLLLRKQQKKALEQLLSLKTITSAEQPILDDRKSTVQKLIMGDGKSKVVTPIWTELKADGTNLVVVEEPPALLETNFRDLSSTSQRLFYQRAYLSTFSRDSDCSPAVLEFSYDQFIKVIESRGYVVTDGGATQSRELKYLEFLLQSEDTLKTHEEYVTHEQQIQALEKLVVLFRTRADVIIDEGHQGLRFKEKLNYTMGDKYALPRYIIESAVDLYQFLDQVSLTTLGPRFIHKTLESVLLDNQLIIEEEDWNQSKLLLAHALVSNPQSPLSIALLQAHKKCTKVESAQLEGYLVNSSGGIPVFLEGLDKKTKEIIALYKQEVSELLKETLRRKLNAKYGASHQRPQEGIAIPYIANEVPNERSKIGNPEEALNCTIQMVLIEGVRPALLKQALNNFLEEARQELLKNPELHSLDDTETGKGFIAWIGQPDIKLSTLCLEDSEAFQKLYHRLHRHKKLVTEILKQQILPNLHMDATILHSDALNHVDMYRSAQVISGTPGNHTTYHQRLHYNKQGAAATDGFIINLLRKKQTQVRPIDYSTPTKILQGIFARWDAGRPIHAIIDICAAFKGQGNEEVSRLISQYMRDNQAYFAQYTPILQYVVFMNSKNMLCAMRILDNHIIELQTSDPTIIDKKLGCGPEARFSYYDQNRITGLDLRQAPFANAKVLVDKDTQFTDTCQGSYRMRGLADEQTIEILCPLDLPDTNFEVIVKRCIENEQKQLRQDNFSAAQAKMTNIIRNDLLQRILALPPDHIKKKKEYAVAFKKYLVEIAQRDIFEKYGHVAVNTPAEEILEAHKTNLLADWKKMLESVEPTIDLAPLHQQIEIQCNVIIQQTLPICEAKYLKPTQQDLGLGLEVQKEVELQLQTEVQVDKQCFNPSLQPAKLEQWYWDPIGSIRDEIKTYPLVFDRQLLNNRLLSLTHMCQQRDAIPSPVFDNMYVTANYYKTYQLQEQFLDPYLKPVHGLLFLRNPETQKLSCVILSPYDLDTILSGGQFNAHSWITTTQHTILCGTPPKDIDSDPQYMRLIEQARYFNGELAGLIDADMPLQWLEQNSSAKLAFFEQYIMRYRDVKSQEVTALRAQLSKRSLAFDYIAAHPLTDYNRSDFSWQSEVALELTEEDIEQARTLVFAFQYANQHWSRDQDDSPNPYMNKLPLQAQARLNHYYQTLKILRDNACLLSQYLRPQESLDQVAYHRSEIIKCCDRIPAYFIQEGFPGDDANGGSILHYLAQRFFEYYSMFQINIIEPCTLLYALRILVGKGLKINAVNKDGYTALECLLPYLQVEGLPHVLQQFAQLSASMVVHPEILHKLSLMQLQAMKEISPFVEDNEFLACYALSFIQQWHSESMDAEGNAILENLLQNDPLWAAVLKSIPANAIPEKLVAVISMRLDQPKFFQQYAAYLPILLPVLTPAQISTVIHGLISQGYSVSLDVIDRLLTLPAKDIFDLCLFLVTQADTCKILQSDQLTKIINLACNFGQPDQVSVIVQAFSEQENLTQEHVEALLTLVLNLEMQSSDEHDALCQILLNSNVFQAHQTVIVQHLLSLVRLGIDRFLITHSNIKLDSQQLITIVQRNYYLDGNILLQILDNAALDSAVIAALLSVINVTRPALKIQIVSRLAQMPVILSDVDILQRYFDVIGTLREFWDLFSTVAEQVQQKSSLNPEIDGLITQKLMAIDPNFLWSQSEFFNRESIKPYYLQGVLVREDFSDDYGYSLMKNVKDLPDDIVLKVIRSTLTQQDTNESVEHLLTQVVNGPWHLLSDEEIVRLFAQLASYTRPCYLASQVYVQNAQRINSILIQSAAMEVCGDLVRLMPSTLTSADIAHIFERLNTMYQQNGACDISMRLLLENILQRVEHVPDFPFYQLGLEISAVIASEYNRYLARPAFLNYFLEEPTGFVSIVKQITDKDAQSYLIRNVLVHAQLVHGIDGVLPRLLAMSEPTILVQILENCADQLTEKNILQLIHAKDSETLDQGWYRRLLALPVSLNNFKIIKAVVNNLEGEKTLVSLLPFLQQQDCFIKDQFFLNKLLKQPSDPKIIIEHLRLMDAKNVIISSDHFAALALLLQRLDDGGDQELLRIFCSGTILGNNPDLLDYFLHRQVASVLLHHRLADISDQQCLEILAGFDQWGQKSLQDLAIILQHFGNKPTILAKVFDTVKRWYPNTVKTQKFYQQMLTKHAFCNADSALVKQQFAVLDVHLQPQFIADLLNQPQMSHAVVDWLVRNPLTTLRQELQIVQTVNISADILATLLEQIFQSPVAQQHSPEYALELNLLQTIVNHPEITEQIMQAAAPRVLERIKMEPRFWNAIPANRFQCIHLSGSRNAFNQCSIEALSALMTCLSSKAPHIDLSDTGFATQKIYKKVSTLKKVFAGIDANVLTHIDLSNNAYTPKQQKRLLHVLPQSVTHIAFENHQYLAKAAYKQATRVNCSFLLKAFMGLAATGGAALLVVGLLAANPLLVGAGLGLVAAAAVAGIVHWGLFHHKPKKPAPSVPIQVNMLHQKTEFEPDPGGGVVF